MRVIIIILIIYIGWKLFWRYVFPFLLSLVVKKAAEKMKQGGGTFYYSNIPDKQEGEVTIDPSGAKKKSTNPKREIDGEYVDFEEVK